MYLVGGSVRDYLLGIPFTDFDMATDATPADEEEFLKDAEFSFSKYGSIRIKKKPIEITTLREEGPYDDMRHPRFVNFVKDPIQDYKRRDFTINAMYLDEDYRLIDYAGGFADLKSKTIRFIGDPEKRIREDPLRIIRALRLREKLNFNFDTATGKAIDRLRPLLDNVPAAKVKEEERKGYHAEE